jgi:peptide/nickel transport system permease protein
MLRKRDTLLLVGVRAGQAIVVAFVCVTVAFLIVRLFPGNPATAILGERATPVSLARLRAELHLNEPLWTAYGGYAGRVVHGDLGHSIINSGETVNATLASTLPRTLTIVFAAVVLSVFIGVGIGLIAALTRWRSVDFGLRGIVAALQATPAFVTGIFLIAVFALALHLLPAGGWSDSPANIKYVVLPSVALSGYLVPLIARVVRQSARDISRELFIEAAIARGVQPSRLMLRYILPNVLPPLISLVAINAGALVTGAVFVEAIFGIPGIGTRLVLAVSQRDYPIIQGIALATALIVVGLNFIADLLVMVVDPRARTKAGGAVGR